MEKVVCGGKGLGRIDGKATFVPFALEGEELEVVITRDKKSWSEAKITSILRPGRSRIAPLCTNFTRCGGCHLQHVPYQRQLQIKEEIIASIFEKFLKEGTRIEPFLPSPHFIRIQGKGSPFPINR